MSPPSDDRHRRQWSRFRLFMLYEAAWLAFVIASAALVARFMPVTNHVILFLTAFSPYLMAGAGVSAVLLLLARQRWTARAAMVLTAVVVSVELPLFIGSNRVPELSVPVRVLTANLRLGRADPAALVAIARERADLLAVQELTPELANSLIQQGIEQHFRYRVLDARPYAAGVGIWSRHRIVRSGQIPGYTLGAVRADIRVPDAADDVIAVSIHLVGNWPQPIDTWRDEITKLSGTLESVAGGAGGAAAVVAGDLNATFDMQPFRRLLRNGIRDAAEQSGAGLTRSIPAETAVPPLVGIDRILTLNSSATNVETVRIPGSDHLGLSATVHIPRG